MYTAMTTYFDTERGASVAIAALGAVTLVFALTLFPARWGLRAFAIALGLVAVVEVAIGIGFYFKTGAQVTRLAEQLASNPAGFYAAEMQRMALVQRNFVVTEYVWVALLLTGAVTAIVFKARPTANGIALGIVVFAVTLLCFDLLADRRGAIYYAALTQHADAGGGNRVAPSDRAALYREP